MRRSSTMIGGAALTLLLSSLACSGGSPASPTSPAPLPAGGTNRVTVGIVADRGSQSFAPNPAAMTGGATIAWRNDDGVVHRIVANDGSFDTGNLAPGATSTPVTPPGAGANYHCSIHPTMVGAIGSSAGEPPPPCTGIYCD